MKIAVVVQRYGADIGGGAELHARYVAERLRRHVDVEVVTTCASDYVTWEDTFPAGTDTVHDILVHRFPVDQPRDVEAFARRSEFVFGWPHSYHDELVWLNSEGPKSRALIRFLRTRHTDYDFVLFFSYRYYHAYHGSRAVGSRALLVPTAERDEAIGLSLFGTAFRGVRALMYNSPEERRMIQAVSRNTDVPGVVVGVGSDIPDDPSAERFRAKYELNGPFAIYVGRIDANKGCRELFDFFLRYVTSRRSDLTLVLMGRPIIAIPEHPRIRHLGFVEDQDKFDGIAASNLLIMPSYYESLSIVLLEALALGVPVLANGRCEVLKGQCIRSNAGLYYETYEEFAEVLEAMISNPMLADAFGTNGRAFYGRHYDWPVIERKYLDMFASLQATSETGPERRGVRLPGNWLSRRRRNLPSAREVLSQMPSGPVID